MHCLSLFDEKAGSHCHDFMQYTSTTHGTLFHTLASHFIGGLFDGTRWVLGFEGERKASCMDVLLPRLRILPGLSFPVTQPTSGRIHEFIGGTISRTRGALLPLSRLVDLVLLANGHVRPLFPARQRTFLSEPTDSPLPPIRGSGSNPNESERDVPTVYFHLNRKKWPFEKGSISGLSHPTLTGKSTLNWNPRRRPPGSHVACADACRALLAGGRVLALRGGMEDAYEESKGFRFDHVRRNAFLAERGIHPPKTLKTGTTIAGVIFKVSRAAKRTLVARNETDRTVSSFELSLTTCAALNAGWRDPRCGHPVHRRIHRGGQKLREDSLHRAEYILLWGWHGGGYRSSDRYERVRRQSGRTDGMRDKIVEVMC